MAEEYSDGFFGKVEPENANKCWKKYFRSPTFINDDDRKWGWGLNMEEEYEQSRVDYAKVYLQSVEHGRVALDPESWSQRFSRRKPGQPRAG
jgi:hypothetical protein